VTFNAAVVQFNPDGTVQSRRHHQLTARMYDDNQPT